MRLHGGGRQRRVHVDVLQTVGPQACAWVEIYAHGSRHRQKCGLSPKSILRDRGTLFQPEVVQEVTKLNGTWTSGIDCNRSQGPGMGKNTYLWHAYLYRKALLSFAWWFLPGMLRTSGRLFRPKFAREHLKLNGTISIRSEIAWGIHLDKSQTTEVARK